MLKKLGFYRGVNLGGWLSQCDYSEERLHHFITKQDLEKIAAWGADHVRIPVDHNVLEEGKGFSEEGFALLAQAAEDCRALGLHVVIDLHKTAGFSFDTYGEDEHGFFESAALQERFYRLWEEIARRFGDAPDRIAFELLNEVSDRDYLPVWNQVVRRCIARIRTFAPETLILVGSYWNNAAEAVKDLEAPFDSRVVYNMHCYEPLTFTHQGAYWTDAIDPEVRIPFAESGTDAAYFEDLFASAIEKAKANGVPLYCGEYGVIDRTAPEDALAWYRTIHSVFERHGIGRCAWSYKAMDFGLTDPRLDSVRGELLRCL